MNGGHLLTVWLSFWSTVLKDFCGIALNHSGTPCTAGVGGGRTAASSPTQRNIKFAGFSWISTAVLRRPRSFAPRTYCGPLAINRAACLIVLTSAFNGLGLSRGVKHIRL